MMTLIEFSKKLNEFYEKGYDKGITNLSTMLSRIKKYVLERYDEIDDTEFSKFRGYGVSGANKKDAIRKELSKIVAKLNKYIKKCSNPKFDYSDWEKLYHLFFDDNNKIYKDSMTTTVMANSDFYRMRSANKYEVYNRRDIFQITGENRQRVSKMRFSDDGHNCLYLGASLYIAWEEVRRASFDTVNFAYFRNTKSLKVIDLTVRKRCKNLTDFVMCYLCLLTSAKVEDEDNYKYRYEVSGLLMKLLQRSIANGGDVDGIKYVSSRQFDGKDIEIIGRSIMEAYVFPPKKVSNKDVDKWLSDTFEVSAVRTTFLYNIHQISFTNPKIAFTTDYMDTLFYQLEQQLKKEKMEKVK